MMPRTLPALLTLSLLTAATPGPTPPAPRAEIGPPSVRWSPDRPAQGAVVRIAVIPDSGAAVASIAGRFGEAPLHLERQADGSFLGVAGVPVDARGTLPLALELRGADGGTTALERRVAVEPGDFRHERLTVAPRFGRQPDSALAARMARESAQARAIAERSVETPRLWGGAWQRPRPSRITSGFGNGREFNGTVQSRHMGTDFAGAVGTPVLAANCGVVALVADFYLAGTAIYVDHGGGLVTGYFHLSRADVAAGDTVRTGQRIGQVGRSGRVTGPHLHWILRSNGVTVNPLSVFTLDSAGVEPRCGGS